MTVISFQYFYSWIFYPVEELKELDNVSSSEIISFAEVVHQNLL